MFLWPVPGYHEVSSHYGDWRPSYGLHGAVNIPAPAVPTIAIGDGAIVFVGWAGSAGRMVWLDLPGGYRVHYAHLSSINVTVGQAVRAGDVIGYVGGSGHGVDNYYGSHLHLNLFASEQPATGPSHYVAWVGKWAVDPEQYLGQEEDMLSDDDKREIAELFQGIRTMLQKVINHQAASDWARAIHTTQQADRVIAAVLATSGADGVAMILGDDVLARIADAVADEQARRLRG